MEDGLFLPGYGGEGNTRSVEILRDSKDQRKFLAEVLLTLLRTLVGFPYGNGVGRPRRVKVAEEDVWQPNREGVLASSAEDVERVSGLLPFDGWVDMKEEERILASIEAANRVFNALP